MNTAKSVLHEADSAGSESDAARLYRLQKLVETRPAEAKEQAWDWLGELRAPSEHHRLAGLFAEGEAPNGPEGDCEGTVMNLYGKLWLRGVDQAVRLGRLLGGMGWAGKTFDSASGTGYNRLTSSTRIPALLAMPGYRFQRVNGELIGFRFYHSIEPSALTPHPRVRAIKYDAPEHANPLVLPRTRDELVELIPDVYLGRALLHENQGWRVVGYFGLRSPRGGQ